MPMENASLIPCSKCSQEISPEAISCPHCGHPHKVYRGFEWRSPAAIGHWPLVHVAFGKNKKTGKWMVAKGVIAIGQFGVGVVTIAQFGVGFLFGFGQFMAGFSALSQFALTVHFAIGQFAAGKTAIGQFAYGKYVLAQVGYGEFVWSVSNKDPMAIEYFQHLWIDAKQFFGNHPFPGFLVFTKSNMN